MNTDQNHCAFLELLALGFRVQNPIVHDYDGVFELEFERGGETIREDLGDKDGSIEVLETFLAFQGYQKPGFLRRGVSALTTWVKRDLELGEFRRKQPIN